MEGEVDDAMEDFPFCDHSKLIMLLLRRMMLTAKTHEVRWTRAFTHSSAMLNEFPNSLIYFNFVFVNKLWICTSSIRMIECSLSQPSSCSPAGDVVGRDILRRRDVFIVHNGKVCKSNWDGLRDSCDKWCRRRIKEEIIMTSPKWSLQTQFNDICSR